VKSWSLSRFKEPDKVRVRSEEVLLPTVSLRRLEIALFYSRREAPHPIFLQELVYLCLSFLVIWCLHRFIHFTPLGKSSLIITKLTQARLA